MIRDAVSKDLSAIVDLCEQLHDTVGGDFEFDRLSAENAMRGLMENGVLLVADLGKVVGVIGSQIGGCLYNSSVPVALGPVFWVDPEHAGHGRALLRALDARLAAMGVRAHYRTLRTAYRPHEMARFFDQEGYVLKEAVFAKVM